MRIDTKVKEEEIIQEEVAKQEEKKGRTDVPVSSLRTSHDLSKQCIYLLGDFMVKDKNGDDISRLFTPSLRSLLTMLILSTEENPEGISGDEITQTLWKNKNKYAARNNRNVTLTKLRNLFERVGNVKIINQENYWKICFGEDVLCDYSEIMTYYQELKRNKLKDEFHLNILLKLLYRGALLFRSDFKWLNPYKKSFSYQTVQLLTSLLNDPTFTDYELRIKIATTLLQHDYMNEEALRTQCILLYRIGKTEQMNSCYKVFCTNYSHLLGIRYTKTIREILKSSH